LAAHLVASFDPLFSPGVGASMVRLLIDTYVRYPAPERAA